MNICLFGSASDKIDQKYKDATEALGREIARRGHTMVFGGGGNGLMGAAARGVAAENGKIIGVIPKFFDDEKIEAIYDNCEELIFCETMDERKQIMDERSDAFIIVPGGIGTYDEFFGVITKKQLGRMDKPIAVYNFDNYYDELESLMYRAMNKRFVKSNCRMLYMTFTDVEEMFDYVEHVRLLGLSVKELKDG